MDISDYINIVAIIFAPVISVIIGQRLQDRAKRRQDKMEIFKALMSSRVYGWTNASVYALNIIDVVFTDDKQVRAQWKAYYDKLCVGNPTEEDLKRIETEKCKLLEEISKYPTNFSINTMILSVRFNCYLFWLSISLGVLTFNYF